MANYGRGWAEGYGHQSKEAMDAAYDRDMAEGLANMERAKMERERRALARLRETQKGPDAGNEQETDHADG